MLESSAETGQGAESSRHSRRVGRVVLAFVAALNGLIWVAAGWVPCDDTCLGAPLRGQGYSWRNFYESWQWDALKVLGGLGVVGAVAYVAIGYIAPRRSVRIALLATVVVTGVAPWLLNATS